VVAAPKSRKIAAAKINSVAGDSAMHAHDTFAPMVPSQEATENTA